MLHKRNLNILVVIVTITLSLSSCKVKKSDFENLKLAPYSPEVGLSIVKSDITVQKALTEEKVKVKITQENGILVLNYYDTLQVAQGSDLVRIPTGYQTADGTVVGPNFATAANILPPSSRAQAIPGFTINGSIPLDIDGVKAFNKLTLDKGLLQIEGYSTLRHSLNFDVTFNGIQKNGLALTRRFALNYTGSIPVLTIASQDLSDYVFTPSPDGKSIPFTLSNFEITKTAQTVLPTDSLKVKLSFSNVLMKEIEATNVSFTFDEDRRDTIPINFFENTNNLGDFYLAKPVLEVTAINEFPVKSEILVENIYMNYAKEKVSSPIHTLNAPKLPIPVVVNTNNTANPDVFRIADIQQPLRKSPNSVSVQTTNAKLSANSKIILKAAQSLSLFINIRLPLIGSVTGLSIIDTIEAGDMPKANVIERAQLDVYSENLFPVELGFRITFLDEQNLPLFTLPRATEDPILLKPKASHVKSYFITKEEYLNSKLEQAKKVRFEGTLNTGNDIVEIREDQLCRLQIVAKAKATIDLNDPESNLNK